MHEKKFFNTALHGKQTQRRRDWQGGGRKSGGAGFGPNKRSFSRGPKRTSRSSSHKNIGPHIDVARFINKASVTEEATVYVPIHRFSDFAIKDVLKRNIASKNYEYPTPIQDKTIPHILKGEDIVGIANTGTGKTAAFLIPLINNVLRAPKEKVLILTPTRELAQQIDEEFKGFSKDFRMNSVCAVGGVPIMRQLQRLRIPHNFIIGTPGRVKDLIERKALDISDFRTLVLDEADRMLDMGFVQDMRFLVSLMPKERHTLFFSATFSREIEALVHDFLKNPVRVSVKTQDTSKNVDQDVVRVRPGENKVEVLHDILIQPEFKKTLVFGRTKYGVEKLAIELGKRGFRAESIHGDKNQRQRERALDGFKKGNTSILVATDVAARGLDISGVTHVVNYDIPETYEDYIHRIGRTGRAGAQGKALTFIEHR